MSKALKWNLLLPLGLLASLASGNSCQPAAVLATADADSDGWSDAAETSRGFDAADASNPGFPSPASQGIVDGRWRLQIGEANLGELAVAAGRISSFRPFELNLVCDGVLLNGTVGWNVDGTHYAVAGTQSSVWLTDVPDGSFGFVAFTECGLPSSSYRSAQTTLRFLPAQRGADPDVIAGTLDLGDVLLDGDLNPGGAFSAPAELHRLR